MFGKNVARELSLQIMRERYTNHSLNPFVRRKYILHALENRFRVFFFTNNS
ncbi:hypothetical protein Lalb_Chr12g0198091 [Lupinus albus]|uniref:Uncharacterized protein n=1 Tax=Lupinus albus TaxID=3870 RepID=A0A6A4PL98_LUPAL|nr:hypothetical protein Lalb_Chr12g0198091 [Lupinus albus]